MSSYWTVVVPIRKTLPDAGEQVGASDVLTASTIETVYVTLAPTGLVASAGGTSALVGTTITGLVVSRTVT